jgi:hypothetical protein
MGHKRPSIVLKDYIYVCVCVCVCIYIYIYIYIYIVLVVRVPICRDDRSLHGFTGLSYWTDKTWVTLRYLFRV